MLRGELGWGDARVESIPGDCVRQRIGLVVLGLALGVTPVARAQLEPVGVPPGMVRLEVDGSLENYNRRFFQNGTQDYAGDFVRDSAGSNLWPELTSADTTVAAIIGQPTYRIDLGRTTATTQVNVGTVNLGAALGVSHFLTLFGNVPIVRVRVQPRFALDSTSGDVGFNPADPSFGTGGAATTAFFNQFDVALATLQTNITNGVYDGNPTQKALAQATLADGTALRTHLDNLLLNPTTASPFVPTSGSAAGLAMTNVVTSLQTVLSGSLGVGGFTQPLDLPAQRLAQQDIDNFIGNPGGPVAGLIQDMLEFKLGDIQLGAVLTPIDRWDRPNHRGGARLALTGAITLPTGTTDFSNDFVDLGTGTGYYRLGLGATGGPGKGSFRDAAHRVLRPLDAALPGQASQCAHLPHAVRVSPGQPQHRPRGPDHPRGPAIFPTGVDFRVPRRSGLLAPGCRPSRLPDGGRFGTRRRGQRAGRRVFGQRHHGKRGCDLFQRTYPESPDRGPLDLRGGGRREWRPGAPSEEHAGRVEAVFQVVGEEIVLSTEY